MQFVLPSFRGGWQTSPKRTVFLEWLVRAPPVNSQMGAV
jgi:hypothetical protein